MEEVYNDNVEKVEPVILNPTKLWVIEFDIRGIGKGCAMVKAPNANEANQILRANGMYNATPSEYLITKTEEIDTPHCCGLLAEQTVDYFNNN